MPDRIAAVPDDRCNRGGRAEDETAPEGNDAQDADCQIGDPHFILKRTGSPADVRGRPLGHEHMGVEGKDSLEADRQQRPLVAPERSDPSLKSR